MTKKNYPNNARSVKHHLCAKLNRLWQQRYTKSSSKDQNFDILKVLYQNKPHKLIGKIYININ